MFNREKYNIENFYVGELYLSYQFDNLLLPTKLSLEEEKERRKMYDVVRNGAIDFQRGMMGRYVDWENRKDYEGFLTIFYKDHDDYICLHNAKRYSFNGFDYCENLVPLSDLMPKVGYNISTDLSIRDSLCLFEHLFHSKKFNKIEKMQDKTLYNINDFYIGDLNLYRGFRPNDVHKKYHYYNLPQKYLLYKNALDSSCIFAFRDKRCDEYGESIGSHDYTTFQCVFLQLPNRPLYNINNFQFYDKGCLDNEEFNDIEVGESYYDRMIPLSEIIKENNMRYENDSITVQKTLKLTRKIK